MLVPACLPPPRPPCHLMATSRIYAVLPTIPDAQAKDMFSDIEYVSVPSGKKYLRMVNDPSSPKGTLASMIKGSATHIAIALAGVLAGFMAGRRCSM